MFDEIDRAYFERRAQEERERAERALAAGAARTHSALAEEFQRKADCLAPAIVSAA